METSAKDSINVQIAFERVLTEIYKIATKNAIKDSKPGSSLLSVGDKISGADEENEISINDRKGIHLDSKKPKRNSNGCC